MAKVQTLRAAALAIVVVLAVAGCGAGKGDPTATGTVGEIQSASEEAVTFLLETSDMNSSMHNAMITVSAGDLDGATPTDLATGDSVKVWATVCAQSFPPQCQATSVEVE